MKLYRPVGLRELELIAASGYRALPPRLPEQPIFYPVLNQLYAKQLARDWNTKDRASGYAGFVTMFEVDESYVKRFPVQVVGSARRHEELWVPAEELATFNEHIIGIIIVKSFYGEAFDGEIDHTTGLPKNRKTDG